ncbi:hypothetical protein E2542_SST21431 [Spatholobus suberectus]|nr:hypothetical protein E2542_SST21431 [Spatholobus suberectus]
MWIRSKGFIVVCQNRGVSGVISKKLKGYECPGVGFGVPVLIVPANFGGVTLALLYLSLGLTVPQRGVFSSGSLLR